MNIEKIKISYSTTIPIMSYGVNDKIGVEMELSPAKDNEEFDMEAIIAEHKANVDVIVRKLYPQYHQESNSQFANSEQISIIKQNIEAEERRIGDIENDIRSCKELKVLETYKLIAKSKPEFQTAYNDTFQKLSNQCQEK